MAGHSDFRAGRGPDFHDTRELHRARLRKAATLHRATVITWLVIWFIAFVVLSPESRFGFLLVAIPLLAGLALSATSASLCQSPDPEKTEWLLGNVMCWFGSLTPKGKAIAVGSVLFAGLASMSAAIPTPDSHGRICSWSMLARLIALLLAYLAYARVLLFVGYESDAAYRSRVGLPPLPRPEVPTSDSTRPASVPSTVFDADAVRRILAIFDRNRRAGIPDDATVRSVAAQFQPPSAPAPQPPLTQDSFRQP
jgi:hypothetical protein